VFARQSYVSIDEAIGPCIHLDTDSNCHHPITSNPSTQCYSAVIYLLVYAACGGACTIDSDCNQFGNNCTSCMNGKCFGACGQPCNQDSQCDPCTPIRLPLSASETLLRCWYQESTRRALTNHAHALNARMKLHARCAPTMPAAPYLRPRRPALLLD